MQSEVENKSYKYDVFISYSRKDTKFARKLEKALTNYRPPKMEGINKEKLNIFLDESDLIGADYFDAIESYLGDARKLILICSPNSANSEFVNDELKRFIDRNGSNNVIPVIIDGFPSNEVKRGQEEFNAFPPELIKEIEMPLAKEYRNFNLNKDRLDKGIFENSWLSILAELLDISREKLEQREKKRQRKKRRITVSLVSAIFIALSALTIFAFVQRNEAVKQANISKARLLGQQAKDLFTGYGKTTGNPFANDLAMLLSVEALKITQGEPHIVSAENILRSGTSNRFGYGLVAYQGPIPRQDSYGFFSKIDPNDHWLITYNSLKNNAILWELKDTNLTLPFYSLDDLLMVEGFHDIYYSSPFPTPVIKLSNDGNWLVTVKKDSSVVLLNLFAKNPTKEPNLVLPAGSTIGSVTFSPDSKLLAVTCADSTVRILDLHKNQFGIIVNLSNIYIDNKFTYRKIRAVYFSPNNNWVITPGHVDSSSASIWNLGDPSVPYQQIPAFISAYFSSDNRWLVTSGEVNSDIWKLPNNDSVKVRDYYQTRSELITVSSDNRWLHYMESDKHMIFELAPGTIEFESASKMDSEVKRKITNNGRWLAKIQKNGESSSLILTDLETKNSSSINLIQDEYGNVADNVFAFSPNGRWLAVKSEAQKLDLYNLDKGLPLVLDRSLYGGYPLIFSNDDRWFLTGNLEATGDGNFYFEGEQNPILWDLSSPSSLPLTAFGNVNELGYGINFKISSDNRWLIGTGIFKNKVLDLKKLNDDPCITELPYLSSSTVSEDHSNLLIGFNDGSLRTVDLASEIPKITREIFLPELPGIIGHVGVSPDNRWLITSRHNSDWKKEYTELRDFNSGKLMVYLDFSSFEKNRLRNETNQSGDMQFLKQRAYRFNNENQSLFTFRKDIEPKVWTNKKGSWKESTTSFISSFTKDSAQIIAISEDSRILVFLDKKEEIWIQDLSDLSIKQLHIDGAALPVELLTRVPGIPNCPISPHGKWLITKQKKQKDNDKDDDNYLLWNIETLSNTVFYSKFLKEGDALFSPDERWLFTGDHLIDLSAGDKSLKIFRMPDVGSGYGYVADNATFSPDSRWLLAQSSYGLRIGSDLGPLQLIDLNADNPIYTIAELEDADQPILFSPDKRWLATSDFSDNRDNNVKMWALDADNPAAEPLVFPNTDMPLAFNKDNKYLITVTKGKYEIPGSSSIIIWPLEINEIIRNAAKLVGRNLSFDEWSQYFPGEPYRKIFPDLPGPQESKR